MTEQISKLDVKTLEYVVALGEKRIKQYDNFASVYGSEGDKAIAEQMSHKRLATQAFISNIQDLIREQQEQ